MLLIKPLSMQIELADGLHFTSHINRQERFGADGKSTFFSAALKGVYLNSGVYQLKKTAEVTVIFHQPTLLICMGRTVQGSCSTSRPFALQSNEAVLFLPPAAPLTFHLKAQGYYQLFFIGLTGDADPLLLNRIEQLLQDDGPILQKSVFISAGETAIINTLLQMQPSKNMQMAINGALHLATLVVDKITSSLRKSEEQVIVERAKDYMLLNLSAKQNILPFCHAAGLTDSAHYKLFEENYGLSPQEFIAQAKYEKACELLATTAATIKEVSNAVGFATASALDYLFQQRGGISPGEYRKQKQQQRVMKR
jgi:AraC-like DNA-binding protein